MSATVHDVREGLLELARDGDAVCGGEWSKCEEWHTKAVDYVRTALGDERADDLATRIALRRGATQAEKESNAVASVKDWLNNQAGLLTDKVVPGFTGDVPKVTTKPSSGIASVGAAVMAAVKPKKEKPDGDIGPKD